MFERMDGTQRTPYDSQVKVLRWLEDNWNKSDVFAIVAPTAFGKSFLARSIQLETCADIVTINNELVRQMADAYRKDITVAIGRAHYKSPDAYITAHGKAFSATSHMLYNSVTFFNSRVQEEAYHKPVVILDEADQQLSLLLLRISTKIKLEFGERGQIPSIDFAKRVLEHRIIKHRKALNKKYSQTIERKMLKALHAKSLIEADSASVACSIEDNELIIKPLYLPTKVINKLFGNSKLILLSGTLFPEDITDLIGRKKYISYQAPSPIPVENRKVIYEPIESDLSYPVNYDEAAKELIHLLEKYPQRPAVVHVTYNDMSELSWRIPNTLVHDKHNKKEALKKLEKTKGVLLAAGMTTGIDLKDDMCRLNIIFKASFPSTQDTWVKKRMAKTNGDVWRVQQVLKSTVQAAGRSTRSPNDASTVVIADRRIMALIARHWDLLPSYFTDALILGGNNKLEDFKDVNVRL